MNYKVKPKRHWADYAAPDGAWKRFFWGFYNYKDFASTRLGKDVGGISGDWSLRSPATAGNTDEIKNTAAIATAKGRAIFFRLSFA